MANTLYIAVYDSAQTGITWDRANIATRGGFSGSTGYVAHVVDGSIITADGDETGNLGSVLTAGSSYKLWAIVDDGSTSSNSGVPQESGAFMATPTLAVADAAHAHAADNITLTTATTLVIDDAAHAHTAENLSLSTVSLLAVDDALHAHSADNLTLGLDGSETLSISDALHAHAADSLGLTSEHALVISDSMHAHTADGLTLTADSLLAIQDALHAHAADNLTLSDAPALLIADALHAHTADGVTMTVDAWLVIADSTHAQSADNVILLVPGGETWPDPATVLVGIMYGPTGVEYTGTLQTCGDTLGATVARIEKWLRNKRITDPNTGLQTVYDDDGVTVLGQGNLYEDAAGTQPYRAQGADRAERLA